MANQIHPTAIIESGAVLGDEITIGPYVFVGPDVTIGNGTRIDTHSVIEGKTTIGENNHIFTHVTLGQAPQDLKFKGEKAELIIGDNNQIREHASVHIGTENGGGSTSIGSNNLIMVGAHIAHDSHLGNHIILGNTSQLAGHITIQDHAIISGAAGAHHFVTIGRYAFIGGITGLVHDAPPFMVTDGHHGRVRGVNVIGLTRNGFSEQTIANLKVACRDLYLKTQGTQADAIVNLKQKYADDEIVMELLNFAEKSASGTHGRYAESFRPDDKRKSPTQ